MSMTDKSGPAMRPVRGMSCHTADEVPHTLSAAAHTVPQNEPGPEAPPTAQRSRTGPLRVGKTYGVTKPTTARPVIGKQGVTQHLREHVVTARPPSARPARHKHTCRQDISRELGNSGPSCHKRRHGNHNQRNPGKTNAPPPGANRPDGTRGAPRAQGPVLVTEADTVTRHNERPVTMRSVFRIALTARSVLRGAVLSRTGHRSDRLGPTYTHRTDNMTSNQLLKRAAHINASAAHLHVATAPSGVHQPLGAPETPPRPDAFQELDSALPPQAAPPPSSPRVAGSAASA